jgi:hypothetical protein
MVNIGRFIPKKVIYKRGDFEITTNEFLDLALDLILIYIIYQAAVMELLECKRQNTELIGKYYSLFNISDRANATNAPSIDISKFNLSTQP